MPLSFPTLSALKQWCHEHISTDIEYSGSEEEQRQHYAELVEQYTEVFPTQKNQLAYAALHGYDRYISQLDAPASTFNQLNEHSMSPLHLAAVKGHINTVKALLQRGAEASCLNSRKQYPLFVCLQLPYSHDDSLRTKKETIFQLLNTAAPGLLEHLNDSGDSVFHLLATHNYSTLLKEASQQAPRGLSVRNNWGNYPVHCALSNGAMDVIAYLLNKPEMNELTDSNGWNALHYAAHDHALSSYLAQSCQLSPVSSINQLDYDGNTPLDIAIAAGNEVAITTLKAAGGHANPKKPHKKM
jgi:ankyrin repeat protein